MVAATAERSMGRKRSANPRNDVTVKLDATVVEMAKFVALDEDRTLAELLTDILRAPVEKRYNEVMARRNKAVKGK